MRPPKETTPNIPSCSTIENVGAFAPGPAPSLYPMGHEDWVHQNILGHDNGSIMPTETENDELERPFERLIP